MSTRHQRSKHRRYRRHPAEVTSDRLAEAVEKWWEHFTGEQRDCIGEIRHTLELIAEGANPEGDE